MVPLTPEEQAWVQSHGPLRYAPEPSSPPFELCHPDGKCEGITPEILSLLARHLGIEVATVQYTNRADALEGLKQGKVDLLGALSPTEKLKTYLDFTPPYLEAPNVLFVTKKDMKARGLEDFASRRVGVVSQSSAQAWLQNKHPEILIMPVATAREGLLKVASGTLDAMFTLLPVGEYLIAKNSLTNLRMVPGIIFNQALHLAIRKDNPVLLGLLRKGLQSVSQSERLLILNRWTKILPHDATPPVPTWVWQSLLALLSALVLFAFWNYSLRRLVARRTQTIQESKNQVRSILQTLPIAAAWADDQGRVEFLNEKFTNILGYTLEDIPTIERWFELAYPDPEYRRKLWALSQRKMNQARREGRSTAPVEVHATRKDGATRTIEIIQTHVAGKSVLVVDDVTERKRTHEALRRSEANLADAQRIARLGSWETSLSEPENHDQAQLQWSDEVFRIFGYEPGSIRMTSANFFRAVHPEDRARIREAVEQAIQNHQPYQIDHRILLPDGLERVVHEQAEVIYDRETGRALRLVGTVQDITERRQAEATRVSLESQLRQAQKMEAIGQLAGGVAHDFNNILTIIIGHACLLGENSSLDSAARSLARQISKSADRAANLTRQLLVFSRQQVMRIQPLNLNDVLAHVYKMLKRLLGEHISLNCQYHPNLPRVEADTGMVEQVIMNLAINARDAMPQGGQLTIQTDVLEFTPGQAARNPEARAGRFAVLTVKDTGCGMSDATIGHIFEPFFTTKDIGKGTGLGLASVYGIVKQHEGWIEVTSEVNQGSTFKIILPVCPEETAQVPAPKPNSELARGHETILLVEDESAVRNFVKACLGQCGYRVMEAPNGVEALQIWELHKNEIDLLLTDVVMPEGLSGQDLAKRLKAENPSLRVLFTSGYSRDFTDEDPELLPNESYLPKPFTPATLSQTVRACLQSR